MDRVGLGLLVGWLGGPSHPPTPQVGPAPLGQSRTCVSGQTCHVESLLALHPSLGDRVMALATCGESGGVVRRWPAGGAARADAGGFGWGAGAFVTAAAGAYRLCWCGVGGSCSDAEGFVVDAGELVLIGPSTSAWERTRQLSRMPLQLRLCSVLCMLCARVHGIRIEQDPGLHAHIIRSSLRPSLCD